MAVGCGGGSGTGPPPYSWRRRLQCKFFPSETALFITLSHRCCRIFNLSEQRQVKKLRGAHSHLCCLDIHSGPENRNILLGAQERAVQWYDLDLSNLPYRKLRAHTAAVRDVVCGAGAAGRDALEGKGPQRRPQERLSRRLKAVDGGYCRL